jgi:hypothetical protein
MLIQIKKMLSVTHKPISADDVRASLGENARNDELVEWLAQVGEATLDIPWSAELLRIYPAHEIEERQKGYASSKPGKPNQWNPNWIVFGDVISDPLIFDTATSPGNILFAFHGHGAWTPLLLAPSLAQFDAALSVWCELFLVKYDRDVFTDDFVLRDEFLSALRQALAKVLPPPCVEVFLKALD